METKIQYKTRHKEELAAYLRTIPGQHVTAADIYDHFRREGKIIGTTTIYRQLERLVEDGLVNKYIIDAGSPACFAYIAERDQSCVETCFHCKCEKCGVLIHLHCDELEMIQNHLRQEHGFILNPKRTVFYGVCEECRKKEAENE